MDAESLCNPSAARRAPPLALRRPAAMLEAPGNGPSTESDSESSQQHPSHCATFSPIGSHEGPNSLLSTLLRRTTSPDTLGSQNPACRPAHRQPVVTAWEEIRGEVSRRSTVLSLL